jgi:Uroporphyrinogen decarboxylase (URO-D)
MQTTQDILTERRERIRKAVALEKVDRTPIVLLSDGFHARQVGVKMADFCKSLMASNLAMVEGCKKLGDIDGSNFPFVPAMLFPLDVWLKVKVPGVDLPEDALWQLDERQRLSVDDYDTILTNGFKAFNEDFVVSRLGVDLAGMRAQLDETPRMVKNFEDAGYVVYSCIAFSLVNELLGCGRSMPMFVRDMYKIPDKVQAVLDLAQEEQLKAIHQLVPATRSEWVFVSPSRGASEMYAPRLWERFVWRYLKQVADAIIQEGAVINFHMDSNWQRDLDFFRDFPKGKCVFETDGTTNIRKIKEKLGDRMCIKGDVPAALLTLGTPDQVYDYCVNLIKDMGQGFILSSGCNVPDNAKLENVKALIAAAHDT